MKLIHNKKERIYYKMNDPENVYVIDTKGFHLEVYREEDFDWFCVVLSEHIKRVYGRDCNYNMAF